MYVSTILCDVWSVIKVILMSFRNVRGISIRKDHMSGLTFVTPYSLRFGCYLSFVGLLNLQ